MQKHFLPVCVAVSLLVGQIPFAQIWPNVAPEFPLIGFGALAGVAVGWMWRRWF